MISSAEIALLIGIATIIALLVIIVIALIYIRPETGNERPRKASPRPLKGGYRPLPHRPKPPKEDDSGCLPGETLFERDERWARRGVPNKM